MATVFGHTVPLEALNSAGNVAAEHIDNMADFTSASASIQPNCVDFFNVLYCVPRLPWSGHRPPLRRTLVASGVQPEDEHS